MQKLRGADRIFTRAAAEIDCRLNCVHERAHCSDASHRNRRGRTRRLALSQCFADPAPRSRPALCGDCAAMAARAEPSCDELVHRVQALEAQLAEANEKLAALGAAQAQQQVDGCAQPAQQARMAPAAADTQLGKGPLDGIKVLDFSQYQNGPTATMMLSDYGAEVMKVERPGGEAGRSLGTHDKTGYYFSTYFQALNRGKKSCPLDMNKEGARDVVKRMVQWCDVSACPVTSCCIRVTR